MATQKWCSMALMALLGLSLCSINPVSSSRPNTKIASEPMSNRMMSSMPNTEIASELISNQMMSSMPNYGIASEPASNLGISDHSDPVGENLVRGIRGTWGRGGGWGGGGDGSGCYGGNCGGGSGAGGGGGFQLIPDQIYYCQATTCNDPRGCPGFTFYFGRN